MAAWGAAIAAVFSTIGQALGLWGKHQDRINDPKIVKNVDAKRDLAEKEKIGSAIEKSEKTGNLDEERRLAAED